MKSSKLASLQGPLADLSELHRTEFLDTGDSPACLQIGTSQGTKLAKQRIEAEGTKTSVTQSILWKCVWTFVANRRRGHVFLARPLCPSGCSRARGRCWRTNADRLSRCSCVFQLPGWFTLCFFRVVDFAPSFSFCVPNLLLGASGKRKRPHLHGDGYRSNSLVHAEMIRKAPQFK